MKAFRLFLHGLITMGASMAAFSIAGLFILGLLEIILRQISGSGLNFHLEITGYLTAFAFLWGSGWTFENKGHVQVTLLKERLSEQAIRSLHKATNFIGLFLSLLVTYALFDWAVGSYLLGSKSFFGTAMPLWIPQVFLAFGPLTLAAAFLKALMDKGERT